MGAAKKLQRRAAPRFRFKDDRRSSIRFTSSLHRDIHTTKIFDISSTGLSFICSKRLAPHLRTILKMEFSPSGGVQMAVLGRVMRIEDPREKSEWARFPGTVKVGVQFHKLPKQYIKLIKETIDESVSEDEMIRLSEPVYHHMSSISRPHSTWFEENVWTVTAGLVIVAFAALMFYVIFDPSNNNTRPTEAPWASNFFDKVIKKPGQ